MVDRLITQDGDKLTVSIGQAIKGMVLNGLGFTHRALYLTLLFFRDNPVDRLIGEGINAEHLNDDVLGRALDKIYHYGPEGLYAQVAAQAVAPDLMGNPTESAYRSLGVVYGDVKQRWVVIYSPEARL